jgi:hypothetical protein
MKLAEIRDDRHLHQHTLTRPRHGPSAGAALGLLALVVSGCVAPPSEADDIEEAKTPVAKYTGSLCAVTYGGKNYTGTPTTFTKDGYQEFGTVGHPFVVKSAVVSPHCHLTLTYKSGKGQSYVAGPDMYIVTVLFADVSCNCEKGYAPSQIIANLTNAGNQIPLWSRDSQQSSSTTSNPDETSLGDGLLTNASLIFTKKDSYVAVQVDAQVVDVYPYTTDGKEAAVQALRHNPLSAGASVIAFNRTASSVCQ